MTEETVSDLVAENIREARKRRGWKPAELAARCADVRAPDITENAIENIESGRRANGRRRRDVTVDELLVLAYALDIAPVYLICGLDDTTEIPVTPQLSVTSIEARNWIHGFGSLAGTDEEEFARNLPVSMRGGYARNFEEQLAAVDSLREDILRQRTLQERMAEIRERALGLPHPAKGDNTDGPR